MSVIKHFEDLWNACEEVGATLPPHNISEIIDLIITDLILFKASQNETEKNKLIGTILFNITKISKLSNINVASALNIIYSYKANNKK